MAFYAPACAIGFEKITGSLKKDEQAVTVILDNQLEVIMTIVKGGTVYRKNNSNR